MWGASEAPASSQYVGGDLARRARRQLPGRLRRRHDALNLNHRILHARRSAAGRMRPCHRHSGWPTATVALRYQDLPLPGMLPK
eukprot:361329-Chlamydomonas_euryale.AAC.8